MDEAPWEWIPWRELRDIGAGGALSSFSSAHSISCHCVSLIVSTASAGVMYIGRMLLLMGQLAGRK